VARPPVLTYPIFGLTAAELALGATTTQPRLREGRWSGRIEARTGLRMMPTFPRPPLRFRKAGFPRYGSKDAMSWDEGRRSFPAISFVQVVIGKGDTGKWIEQLTPQLLRIGSSARWS
jgi:hypothetical protein